MSQPRPWFRPSRSFLSILGGIALILFSAYMWGFQTAVYFMLHHEAKKTRILDYTPTQMQPVDPNPASGMALSHRGITLEVPWKDLNVDKSRVVGTWAIFAFDSGPIVTLCTPFKNDIRGAVEKEFGGPKAIEAVFGPEAVRSDFAFHQAVLQESTTRMRPWMNRQEAVRSSMILLIKAISSVGGETGLYKVAANDWKGFQFDDPSKRPGRVTLELYDGDDRHVEVSVAVRKDSKNPPTQADINRILVSLHRSDAADTLASKESEPVAAR